MIILPDVKYDGLCPQCDDAEVARIQAELASLRLTDRYRQLPAGLHARPVFRCVEYGVESCYNLYHKPVPGNLCVYDGLHPSQLRRPSSPPQSPFGSRHSSLPSLASSPSRTSSYDNNHYFPTASGKYNQGDTQAKHPFEDFNPFDLRYIRAITVNSVKTLRRSGKPGKPLRIVRKSSGLKIEVRSCKYGTRRWLTQIGDDHARRLCWGHRNAVTEAEKERACPSWDDEPRRLSE